MKRYKIFSVDKNNMIEFTREELQSLLDEAYNEGFSDGKLAAQTTLIHYPTNDPGSTGKNPLDPCYTWMGPNDVPTSCIDSNSYTYSTTTTTARNEGNL